MTDAHHSLIQAILGDPWWDDATLEDPAWRKAFDQVSRAPFAPGTWFEWDGYGWLARHRAGNENAWQQAVHTPDKPFITQVDADGAATCSLSAPKLVAAMVGALGLGDGMRVFESGAGLGWTASLMAERVGPDGLVVAVEYDPALAEQAALNAAAVGAHPVILNGDGEAGAPAYAPFDRVSVTHAVRRIPPAWIAQARTGGLVCAPLKVADHLDLFVRLVVAGDGSAEGRVVFPVDFMPSRTSVPAAAAVQADDPKRSSRTDFDLPAVVAAKELWPIQVAVPGLTVTGPLVEDGDDCMWLTTPDGSWAVAYVPQGVPWKGATVEQHGPQDLWTLAESAWARWNAAGAPGVDGYGLSVSPDGTHRLWIGDEGQTVAVLP